MAIYHFSAKVIGRSSGRSAVAAAAYRSASELVDERLGRSHDYTSKAGVIYSEILLPKGAPERWLDRATLWNEVESGERRKDAQLARDIEISLPRELGRAEAIRLAQDFVREQFVSRGMVADLNVHWSKSADGELQPHAHIMLSMREVVPGRAGQAEGGAFGKKVVAWNDRALLGEWRERWASLANERLCELGHDARIDHRSYADQGISLEPQHKIGPAGARRSERGEDAERRAEHDAIARRNGERIAEDPSVALDALTRQHSTFTKQDLARFVSRHSDGAEQFASVLVKVEASAELVRLGVDGRGRDRFSTREMLLAEQRMEQAAAGLAGSQTHRVGVVEQHRAVKAAEAAGLVLGGEQRHAVRHVTTGADLALVVGYAGTGKSAMLGVASAAWEREGYRVRGAALSGIAAEGLEAGSGIQSRTLASLEWGWKEGRDPLTSRDVLVVDEAGMVGSRQMERVLAHVREAGAKVVLVGDPEQLQAIEAGAAFRALAERHGAVEITEVRRQREAWQREATRELATARTEAALGRYEAAGMVQGAETQDDAKAALLAGWDVVRRESPGTSQVILAYTRDDVRDLNRLARERLRADGALGPEQVVQTEEGARSFAAGDRLMFRRNERGLGAGPGGRGGVAVKNGTLGTVLAVEAGGERLTVRLDGPEKEGVRDVTFYLRDYAHVDHGYAATTHKAQGVTVDRAHVLASRHMDRHAAYVALTRHRDEVSLHWSRDELGSREGLTRTLGRERAKDTSLDYGEGLAPELEQVERGRRAYAERRGLDPLRPESGIVVQQGPERQASTPEPARPPQRGMFAGLRLGAGRGATAPTLVRAADEPASQPLQHLARTETRGDRLARGLEGYARTWADAARMERAGLPVLPHQEAALAGAGAVLEAEGAGMARDAAAALARSPWLAAGAGAGQVAGVAQFGRLVGEERRGRQALEERGRSAVRAWGELERAYAAAETVYDWRGKREAGERMEAFAKELKQDRALDGLLREHGRELGIAEGAGLERVVQAREVAEATRALRRELGLSQGRGMSMGM